MSKRGNLWRVSCISLDRVQRGPRTADLGERTILENDGDPGKTRTSDTQFRKLLLYPPELRGHNFPSDNFPGTYMKFLRLDDCADPPQTADSAALPMQDQPLPAYRQRRAVRNATTCSSSRRPVVGGACAPFLGPRRRENFNRSSTTPATWNGFIDFQVEF